MTRLLPPHWFLLGLAFAAALPAAYTLDPKLDCDTWWHLAAGRWIVQHREVPWIDPFSQLSAGTPTRWYAYSWLYEIGLYEIFEKYRYLGVMAVRVMITAASTAIAFAFLTRRCGATALTLIISTLLGMVLMMFAKERPWHFTIAFTTITLWAVQGLRDGGSIQRICWLPLLFMAWANLHIQFVLGFLILGLACVLPGLANRRHVILLTLACIVATACNPYHVRLAEVIVEYAAQAAPRELVQELAPPELDEPSTLATIALLMIGYTCAFRSRDRFALTLLIISTMLALRMRRDIWFAVVASLAASPRVDLRFKTPRRQIAIVYGVVLGAFLVIRGIHAVGLGPTTDYAAVNDVNLPMERSARIFNDFDRGGLLIWHGYQPSIDGRTNLHGDERLRLNFATWQAQGNWQHDPRLANAEYAIGLAKSPLAEALNENRQWRIIYLREDIVIFVRK